MAYTLAKTYLKVFKGFNLLGRFVEVNLTKIFFGRGRGVTFLEDFESL